MLPEDPAGAAHAARDTLGAAVGVAERLPGRVGDALVNAAQDAFVQGMRVSTAIATFVAIGVAILAVTMLRHVRSGADREADAELEAGAPQRELPSEVAVSATVGAEC